MLEGDLAARKGALDDAASTGFHERLEPEQCSLNSQLAETKG